MADCNILIKGVHSPMHHLSIGSTRLDPLRLKDRESVHAALTPLNISLSDYTFANNYIWLSMVSGFHARIEGCLCLFALSGEVLTMLLPPLGAEVDQRRALEACFDVMDVYNDSPYLGRIDYVYGDFLNLLDVHGDVPMPLVGGDRWLVEPGNPDYIYRTQDLIELRGDKYKNKRNEINQFRRAFPDGRTEAFEARHAAAALDLTHNWMSQRLHYVASGDVDRSLYYMELERTAIHRTIQHYEELGLEGLCLFNGDEMLGFTFGERINPGVASVLIEKTNLELMGCAQYIFREFSKCFADCEFINVGDDLGMEGLKRVKMSYRPALFGEKYTIKRYVALDD